MSISVNSNLKPENSQASSKGIDDDLFDQFVKIDSAKKDISNSSGAKIAENADEVINPSGDRRILRGDHEANQQAKGQEEAQDVISRAIRASSQFGSII